MTDRFSQGASAFETLCRTMATLRAPGGCPWDAKQTIESLKKYLIEETYECVDAIDQGDTENHCEELGDVLLQVVFQSEVRQEQGGFDVAAVCNAINDKLVRRHPHVFEKDTAAAQNAEEALANWEARKAQERGKDSSCLDGVPRSLPGLLRAQRTGEKVSAMGFDWPDSQGVLEKVREEFEELADAKKDGTQNDREEEMGDLLFSLVNLCRHWNIGAEDALGGAIQKFHDRYRHVEAALAKNGRSANQADAQELDELWRSAKAATA